jgi:AAA domain-containing protein
VSAGFPLTPLGELLARPNEDRAYVVADHLAAGSLNLLTARPKVGKSTLARDLAFCVARGEPWLGCETTPGEVLYLAFEEQEEEVLRHFKAMGATGEEPIRVYCGPAPLDGVGQLRQIVERDRPSLTILDGLFRMVRVADANDYARVTGALDPLLRMARGTGTCVLVTHHLGKTPRDGGEGILGSTAIFGTVDTTLLLRRFKDHRTLSSIQRYGPNLAEIVLRLDPETRRVSAGPLRREAEEEDVARAVLEYLQNAREPVGEADITSAVRSRKALVEGSIRRLVSGGRVVREGSGRRGDPYRYAFVSPFLPPPHERVEGAKQFFVAGTLSPRGPANSPTCLCASGGGGHGREKRSGREKSRPLKPCPECGVEVRQLGYHRYFGHRRARNL